MIMDAGVETNRNGEPRYKFFEQEIFGIEKPLQQIVDYFHSAAQRLEVRKRILLLMGPVGGGKSTIVSLLKRGLEAYSRAPEGAIYAIKNCPMNEEPLHLIPHDLRSDIEKEFGIYIEGDLCPHCRYMVDTQFGGHIETIRSGVSPLVRSIVLVSGRLPLRTPRARISVSWWAALTCLRLVRWVLRVIRAPIVLMGNSTLLTVASWNSLKC